MNTPPPDAAAPSGDVAAAQPECRAQTQRGEACRSFALPDGERCLAHDPERRAALREARARGGAAASRLRSLEGRRARLDTPAALVKFTSKLIQDALDETTSCGVARTVFYGISIQRQLVESGDLERRIAALEQRLTTDKGLRRA